MDTVCLPSTMFTAHNHYAGPKDISIWRYHGHASMQPPLRLHWLRRHLVAA